MFISGSGSVMFFMIIFSVFFVIIPTVSVPFSLAIFLSLLFLIEVLIFIFLIIFRPTILLFPFILPSVASILPSILPIFSVLVILFPILTIRILNLFRFPFSPVLRFIFIIRIIILITVREFILPHSAILTPLIFVTFLRIICLIFVFVLTVL